jgi:hypothetical protein
MPCRRPVAESAVAQVLQPRSHSPVLARLYSSTFHCSVSKVLKQQTVAVVMMGDFEFDIELLISLVDARPVLWDKTDDVYKERIEKKKAWREVCLCLQKDFEALDVKKTHLPSIALFY